MTADLESRVRTKSRILVPLDGSGLAEAAVHEAAVLAKALGADVILLRVVEAPDELIQEGLKTIALDEQWAIRKAHALKYLNGVRARPELAEVTVEPAVEMGRAAETILDFCRTRSIDRIVMTTHGRTGLTRWVFGSVADKVLRAAETTVVLVRPE